MVTRKSRVVAQKTAARKTAAKKAASKPAAPAAVEAIAEAAPAAPTSLPKKKLVRDSFTIPSDEYASLGALKARVLGLGRASKKSELLRAGIAALARMSDGDLKATIERIPSVKTGRPAKAKGESKARSR